MKKRIFLLCFFFVSINQLVAQTNVYSKYDDIVASLNLDSLEESVKVSKNDINKFFNAVAVLEKSRLNAGSCKFGESLYLLDSANSIINIDNTQQIFLALKTQFKVTNYYPKSEIINDFEVLKNLSKKINDKVSYAHTLYSLIGQNVKGEAYEDAPLSEASRLLVKKYYDEIMLVTQNAKNPKLNLIECLTMVEYSLNFDTVCEVTIEKAFLALDIINKYFENNVEGKKYLYTCLAACYNYRKDFSSALFYSKKCLNIGNLPCSRFLGNDLFNIANCYYTNELNDSAKKYYSMAIEVVSNTKPTNLLLLEYCYDRISVLNYYKGNYKQAFEDLYVRDSLAVLRTQREKNSLSVALQHKYEYEKNIYKIKHLEQQKKTYIIAVLVTSLLFLSIVFLLVKNYIANKQLKRLGNFRDRVIAIISHDLRSPFYALQGLNSEVSYLIKNGKYETLLEMANGIDEASSKIGNLLNNLLQWANSSKATNSKIIKVNLNETFSRIISLYDSIITNKKIIISSHFDQLEFIYANENVFELILRNWLDNMLKHSGANSIKISSMQYDAYYKISIVDNGEIDEKTVAMIQKQLCNSNSIIMQSDTGLGLELIAYFSKLEKWKIQFVVSAVNEFSILIPIQKTK